MQLDVDRQDKYAIACSISAGLGALQYRTQLREGIDWEDAVDAGKGVLKAGKKIGKKFFKSAVDKAGDIADAVKDAIG